MDERIPRIHSFPRSGTHLLAATLLRNFYDHRDMSVPRTGYGHWKDRRDFGPKPFGKMFRPSPHEPGYELEPGRVHFYIFRDGRDVAVSLWRAKALLNPKWRHLPFPEFLRLKLDWLWRPSERAKPTMTVVEQWKAHLDSWWDVEGVNLVRFEVLALRPYTVLTHLSGLLGTKPAEFTVVEERVGILPGKGDVGGWRDVFEPEDLDCFFSIVPEDYWGLWRADSP